MKTRKIILFITLLFFSLILSGCADVEYINSCLAGYEYGFWWGLRHGIILFFSFIGSLFSDEIAIYAVNNSGRRYDFGFVLGILILGGGGGSVANNS